MVARAVELMGIDHIGHRLRPFARTNPTAVVEWMRNGTWTRQLDYGEGSKSLAGFPAQPDWFRDSRDFANVAEGLAEAGFQAEEVSKIMGGNWLKFFERSFGPRADQAAEGGTS